MQMQEHMLWQDSDGGPLLVQEKKIWDDLKEKEKKIHL